MTPDSHGEDFNRARMTPLRFLGYALYGVALGLIACAAMFVTWQVCDVAGDTLVQVVGR